MAAPVNPAVSPGMSGVDLDAREALKKLLARVEALEENSSVLLTSTQQNFGLLEEKLPYLSSETWKHACISSTLLHVRDASELKQKHDLTALEAGLQGRFKPSQQKSSQKQAEGSFLDGF